MKHYLVLLSRADSLSAQAERTYGFGRDNDSVGSYTLSVSDDEPFNLTEAVNTLILAEMFIQGTAARFLRAVVLESDGVHQFDENTPVHYFQSEHQSGNFLKLPIGLVNADRTDRFLGVDIIRSRSEGRAEARFYGGNLHQADFGFINARPKQKNALTFNPSGPLGTFWSVYYREAMNTIPQINRYFALDRDGTPRPVKPIRGDYFVGYATDRRSDRRQHKRQSAAEQIFRDTLLTMMEDAASLLFWYQFAMQRFNHQWGDGYIPEAGNEIYRAGANAVRAWFPLAVQLGYHIPNTLGREIRKGTPAPYNVAPAEVAVKNPELVQKLIGELWYLDRYYIQQILPLQLHLNRYASTGQPATNEQRAHALRVYNAWDLVSAWCFAVKSAVCRLWALTEIVAPRRRPTTNPTTPDPVLDYPYNRWELDWEVSFNALLPNMAEILQQPADPFLALEALPVATVALNIPHPAAPSPRVSRRHSRDWEHPAETLQDVIDQFRRDLKSWERGFLYEDEILLRLISKLLGEADTTGVAQKILAKSLISLVDLLQGTEIKQILHDRIKEILDDFIDDKGVLPIKAETLTSQIV